MISANGGLPAHRYTPQVTPRWPRGSEPASLAGHHISQSTSAEQDDRLESAFDERFDNLQAEYAQQLRLLQDEQVRVCHESQTLQQRLNGMPSGRL